VALINPVPNFNFTVSMWDANASLFGSPELGAVVGAVASAILGGFSECQGLNCEMELETYWEGGENLHPHKLVKTARHPNLVFKSGVTFNPGIWDWWRQVMSGSGRQKRKNGLILLMDRGGPNLTGMGLPGLDRIPVAAWSFSNGFPERLIGPNLNAKGNEIAIETLEISHEGLERLSPTMIPGVGEVASAIGL